MPVRNTHLVLLLLALASVAFAGPAVADPSTSAPSGGRVVLLGVPALRWDQVTPQGTPHLWKLAGQGSTAALSVRTLGTVACPSDAWLTASAGARAARDGGACITPPAAIAPGTTVLPGYAENRRKNIEGRFQAPVGLLGETVHHAGKCTAAAGPGAALAVADASGRLDHYAEVPAALTGDLLTRCEVTAVDLDRLLFAPYDPGSLKIIDDQVGAVLARLAPGTTVLAAGLTDGTGEITPTPRMRVLIAAGPGFPAGRNLISDSTRRDGTVITPDLTATTLAAVGLTVPDEAIGRVLRPGGHRDGNLDDAVRSLAGQDVGAQTYRVVLPRFFLGLVIAQVLFFAAAGLILRRRRGRRRVLSVTRFVALLSAAVPVSTYLVNLFAWQDTGSPTLYLLGGIAVADALIVLIAVAGPWRRTLLGSGTVVATVTALTIGFDLLTGTRLQVYSLMGYSPLVGGRYYGLGNIAFAVFATSVILASVGAAQWLLNRGYDRRYAVATVVSLCVIAMALDGAPMWGADFGGVIAIVPGLAITALMVAQKKVSFVRLAAFCVVGGVLVLSIAYLDYLRPVASQTHLGRFFGELLQGHAGPTVERKFIAMVKTIKNPTLFPIVLVGLAVLVTALRRPDKVRAGALDLVFGRAPLLRAGLMGALATAVVGFLVNDSGIAVLALALVVAIPVTVIAGIRALQLAETEPLPTPARTLAHGAEL